MNEKQKKPERKPPKKISNKYLENAALYYLQRYATSSANLKRVLMRKVKRSCTFHQVPVEDFEPMVDQLVQRYMGVGLIDDTVFATARVASLRRQGQSSRAITARLQAKGLTKIQIDAALQKIEAERNDRDETEDAELAAALTFIKRKKLGRYRKKPLRDPKDLQKEMAAMGRAGFSFDTAKRALAHSDDLVGDFFSEGD